MNSIQWNLLYALRYEQCEWSEPETAVERWDMTIEEGAVVQKWIQARINELEVVKQKSLV